MTPPPPDRFDQDVKAALAAAVFILSMLLLVVIVEAVYGTRHSATASCMTSSHALQMKRLADSASGMKSPFVQIMYATHVGMCARMAEGKLSEAIAYASATGHWHIMDIAAFRPHSGHELAGVVRDMRTNVEAASRKQFTKIEWEGMLISPALLALDGRPRMREKP